MTILLTLGRETPSIGGDDEDEEKETEEALGDEESGKILKERTNERTNG